MGHENDDLSLVDDLSVAEAHDPLRGELAADTGYGGGHGDPLRDGFASDTGYGGGDGDPLRDGFAAGTGYGGRGDPLRDGFVADTASGHRGVDDDLAGTSYHVADPRPDVDFEHSTRGWTRGPDGSWIEPDRDLVSGEDEPLTPDDLQSKELGGKYEGEERSAGWRSEKWGIPIAADDARVTTAYATDADRERLAVSVDEGSGRLLDAGGNPLNGTLGWVVDPEDGCFYIFNPSAMVFTTPDGRIGATVNMTAALVALKAGRLATLATMHHSTPLAGRPVAGAGIVTLDSGVITGIDDQSGHYRGEAEYLHQSMTLLEDQGADLSRAEVTLAGGEDRGRGGKEWLREQEELTAEPVTLSWDQFQQTGGNEPQIRRKIGMQDELLDSTADRFASAEASATPAKPGSRAPDPAVDGPGAADGGAAPTDIPYRPMVDVDDSEDSLSDDDDDVAMPASAPAAPPPAAPPPPIESVVDFDTIQAENERALKDAPAGTALPFWQIGAYVLLGPGHPADHYEEFTRRQASNGSVQVVSRGSLVDPGRIAVSGAGDQAAFRQTIAAFTKKRIDFR